MESTLFLSLIDGREREFVKTLKFNEYHLIRNRAYVMLKHLYFLNKYDFFTKYSSVNSFSDEADWLLRNFIGRIVSEEKRFVDKLVSSVKEHEKITMHDVKACEFALRDLFTGTALEQYREYLHIFMTSEDVSNIAYNLLLVGAINDVYSVVVDKILSKLLEFGRMFARVECLARTHGQPASPTTLGKRFAEMYGRCQSVIREINKVRLSGKCSGATGNYNAPVAVVPEFDYVGFSRDFVESFGFVYLEVSNQRNDHLAIVNLFNRIRLLETVLLDICDNLWLYISNGVLVQKSIKNETGSSTMPHKINPWHLEYAQGCLKMGMAVCDSMTSGLVLTRYERSLDDHPFERSYSTVIGYFQIAHEYILEQLNRVSGADIELLRAELGENPQVVSEAIMTAYRLYNIPDAYLKIKGLSRFTSFSRETNDRIRESLGCIPNKNLIELLENPWKYTGLAQKIALEVVNGPKLKIDIRPRVIVYDFDDTLVNTTGFIVNNIVLVLSKYNYSLNEIKTILTSNVVFETAMRKIYEIVKRNNPEFYNTAEEFLAEYRRIASGGVYSAIPFGVAFTEIMKERGYFQAILSNRTRLLERRLEEAGYDWGLFKVFQPRVKKPAKEAFNEIFDQFGMSGEIKYIFIGDHIVDYECAKANDIEFYALVNDDGGGFVSAGLDKSRIFTSFRNILKALL